MGDVKGFLKVKRKTSEYRPVCERVKDYKPVCILCDEEDSQSQASRCMDCGTPFCHWSCPIGNYIPEWNDYMFSGNWQKAFYLLDATNNLPEVTGRVCPAICEYACVLGINDEPVTIRENELTIIEKAFKAGLIKPQPPKKRSGRKVAVVGSGPAGLACAVQLNEAGHRVTVFEKDKKCGGIMRFGIPDFKLKKSILDRRINIWKKEGINFKVGVNVGIDLSLTKLNKDFDAICLAGGSRTPRDLKIEGRDLSGIHFAMDYLVQSNKRSQGERVVNNKLINVGGKRVVVIGGGDTGADCVGTAHRQGAKCVVQIELLEKPPECRSDNQPWPGYPLVLKTSSSHEEGGERHWAVITKKFLGKAGKVKKISCVKVEFFEEERNPAKPKGCPIMKEIPSSEFEIEADLVILAIGFIHPEHQGLLTDLGVEFDSRGNVRTNKSYMTNKKGIFAAGDMRKGQSLIVWAISEGRKAAHYIDKYLMGSSKLALF